MERLIQFLKSLLSKSESTKNSSAFSFNTNSKVITGDGNEINDNSIKNEIHITNNTSYETTQNKAFIYSSNADLWNSYILKSIPPIQLIIGLLVIYLQKSVIFILFSMILLSSIVLYRSYRIPKRYNCHFIFGINVYCLLVCFPFYKILLSLIENSTILRSYFILQPPLILNFLIENLVLTEKFFQYATVLFFSVAILFLITRNTIYQWIISIKGKVEYPLTIKFICSAILYPLIITIIPMIISLVFNLSANSI